MALAYRKTGTPIMLTTLTTMIGMLALTLTDIPIITVFGTTSAMAVAFAFLLILGLLPILLEFWHPKLRKDNNDATCDGKKPLLDIQPMLAKIGDFAERRAKAIVLTYLAIFVLLIYGAFDIEIDTNFSELARESSPLQVAIGLVDEYMMGGMSLEVLISTNKQEGLKDPRVLQAIDELQTHISENYSDKVIKTFSLADVVEDTNQVMHGDDPAYHTVPDDPQLTAQLLSLIHI